MPKIRDLKYLWIFTLLRITNIGPRSGIIMFWGLLSVTEVTYTQNTTEIDLKSSKMTFLLDFLLISRFSDILWRLNIREFLKRQCPSQWGSEMTPIWIYFASPSVLRLQNMDCDATWYTYFIILAERGTMFTTPYSTHSVRVAMVRTDEFRHGWKKLTNFDHFGHFWSSGP